PSCSARARASLIAWDRPEKPPSILTLLGTEDALEFVRFRLRTRFAIGESGAFAEPVVEAPKTSLIDFSLISFLFLRASCPYTERRFCSMISDSYAYARKQTFFPRAPPRAQRYRRGTAPLMSTASYCTPATSE